MSIIFHEERHYFSCFRTVDDIGRPDKAFAWIKKPHSDINTDPRYAFNNSTDLTNKKEWTYFDTLEEAKQAATLYAVVSKLEAE